MKLFINALTKIIAGILLVGILIFLPAGTLCFGGGILLMSLLFIPMLLVGVWLFLKSPELLEKRLDGKEKEATQKGVVAFSGLVFLAGFIVAGLDFRFGWTKIPLWVTLLASVLFLIAYGLYAEVMRENTFLSRKIEVQENQKVVDTGLYGVVRHPMYAATVIMFLMIPLVLGSWFSLLIFLAYPFIIAVRINGEEKMLSQELAGYSDYKERVKYKLLPFIW